MSDTYTDNSVAERDTADEQHIEDEPPLVQAYELHGGYWGATLSKIADPDAPNLTGQIKTRHILAVDAASLEPQVIACLISDFGMLQEDAEELTPIWLVGGEPPVTEEQPTSEPALEPQPKHYDDDVRAEHEPEETGDHIVDAAPSGHDAEGQQHEEHEGEEHAERARDEHGRFVSPHEGEQQPQHIEQHIEHQHVDAQYVDQKPQREA